MSYDENLDKQMCCPNPVIPDTFQQVNYINYKIYPVNGVNWVHNIRPFAFRNTPYNVGAWGIDLIDTNTRMLGFCRTHAR